MIGLIRATVIVPLLSHPCLAQTPRLPEASPESVGMSTPALEEAVEALTGRREARALLVARNGSLVLEHYFAGMRRDSIRNVKSVTKSVQSAMVGLALADGALSGIDQPLSELIEDHLSHSKDQVDLSWRQFHARSDSLRSLITIRDLLTQRTGFVGTELNPEYALIMVHAPDQVRFALELPMDGPPGNAFRYNTAGAMLLNGLLADATGQSPRAYAQERLFTPLGVSIRRWSTDSTGLETGGAELHLTARDMMALGLLYLGRGEFLGQRVLPEEWVDSSLAEHVSFSTSPEDPVVELLPDATGYGLMWWRRASGSQQMSCAWGYGGQFVCLVPELDLVVVTLSSIGLNEEYHQFLFDVIDDMIVGRLTR